MFGRRVELFKMFGFSVKADLSWLIIAALITWSMAEQFRMLEGVSAVVRWLMGVSAAVGLFGSIVLHELSHSLVARRYGLQIKGITLFIFGGVSEMAEEPRSPGAEFAMAIAGPLSSLAIAAVMLGLQVSLVAVGAPRPVSVVVGWLWVINLVLAIFNLLPGFPLDGGRVLRAALWSWKGDLRWATRVAARIGGGLGMVMMLAGVWFMISGGFGSGLWWFLIGLFIRFSARQSYEQMMVRQSLEGEPVSRFMNDHPVSVPPDITVQELIDQYVYRYHFKLFPVVEQGRLVGCISTRQLRDLPREHWAHQRVSDIATSCGIDNTIGPEDDAVTALARMNRNETGRLLVVRDGELKGIITLRDLLKLLSVKAELEHEGI